ncbi:MAG: response regulator [Thermodesulfobacteriota bacterium]
MSAKPKRVLIAEDNPMSRKCLTAHMELLGYEVAAVSNGRAAVEKVREFRPDLAIFDVMMPEMDGIDAAKAVSAISPLPVILVSGHSSEDLAARAIDAGVFAYLMKPVSRKHLLPAVELAFSRYHQFEDLREEVGDLKEAIETRKLVERAKGILMKRCKIDEEDAFKLLQVQSQKENKKMKYVAEMVISASKLI